MMRTVMPMTRPLTVLTAAATLVAVVAGCASKGSSSASNGPGSSASTTTASQQPNDAEKTLEAALPEMMPGYGSLLSKKAASSTTTYRVKGDSCQRFVDASNVLQSKYGTVGAVVAEYLQNQTASGAHGNTVVTLARLPSASDAARVVSDVKSGVAGCPSAFSHNGENITLTAADPPAGTPGDSSAAVVETASGAGSSGATFSILVVQKGSAIVQIEVNGTGQNTDQWAVAKSMATVLVAH